MQQQVEKTNSEEAFRNELEAVASHLARTPRLEQLLRYLAKKYFDGETAELTEYNIATEVFGRKKTEFVASQDAIARVETHRLRKKLAAFYEGPGQQHAVRVSIPLGTYIPHFDWNSGINSSTASEQDFPVKLIEETAYPSSPTDKQFPMLPQHRRGFRRWRGAFSGLMLLLILLAVSLSSTSFRAAVLRQNPLTSKGAGMRSFWTRPTPAAGGAPFVSVPFRMIAGYSGAPQRDDEGDAWGPDRYFNGGWSRHNSNAFISRTGNQFLFRYGRDGDMSYNIPLAPGTYELHLYFMQGSDSNQSEDAENKEIFNVQINGTLVLKNFDIVSDAMGRNVADERVIRDVSPGSDGILHLGFSTVLGTPSLCAIEILTGTPGVQSPVRLVMQPTSYTDRRGQLWRPDDYYFNGRYLSHNVPEGGADDVLPFERYGHFQYTIPVDTRDKYPVTFRFEELFFGTKETSDLDERRSFHVMCNGETLLENLDINKEVGSFHILEKTFHHLKPSAQGKLNFDFEPITNYATVSSIEVLDEGH